MSIKDKYLPSEPCTCDICQAYCMRPGWWTVEEAELAVEAGYSGSMMLEMSPDSSFGVLSPAFKGNEANFALQIFSKNGCTFYKDGLCKLFGTGHEPLECRFCHHDRKGQGIECHSEIEKEWNTERAKRLVMKWGNITGLWQRSGFYVVEK